MIQRQARSTITPSRIISRRMIVSDVIDKTLMLRTTQSPTSFGSASHAPPFKTKLCKSGGPVVGCGWTSSPGPSLARPLVYIGAGCSIGGALRPTDCEAAWGTAPMGYRSTRMFDAPHRPETSPLEMSGRRPDHLRPAPADSEPVIRPKIEPTRKASKRDAAANEVDEKRKERSDETAEWNECELLLRIGILRAEGDDGSQMKLAGSATRVNLLLSRRNP